MVVLACQPIQCMEVARDLRHRLPTDAVLVSLVAATPPTKLRTLFAHPCPLVLHGVRAPPTPGGRPSRAHATPRPPTPCRQGPPCRDQAREDEEFRRLDAFSPSWLRRERAEVMASAADQETGRAAAAMTAGPSQRTPSRRSGAELERLSARAEGLRRGFESLVAFGLSRCGPCQCGRSPLGTHALGLSRIAPCIGADLDWAEHSCEAMAYAAWSACGDIDSALAYAAPRLALVQGQPVTPAPALPQRVHRGLRRDHDTPRGCLAGRCHPPWLGSEASARPHTHSNARASARSRVRGCQSPPLCRPGVGGLA